MTLPIELDLSDVTIVDGEHTPTAGIAMCACGNAQERGGPTSLSGLTVQEWPCCAGRLTGGGHWRYCATLGQITADVR